mgnify:CR=1 FL=1|tara:strand:- start:17753 stop:18619 length:867 start_codon:yes stop_codon:yes gene_type:complete
MELQSVVIFIVFLSFIGIYINVYKSPNLTDPELLRLPKMFRTNLTEKEDLDINEMSADELAARIVQEKNGKKTQYNAIGNIVSNEKGYKNNGLTSGIITTDFDSQNVSSVGTKRPYEWHGASSQREWPDNKTVNAGLPYNLYHPLKGEELKNITAGDKQNNVTKMAGPKIKKASGEQTVGVFIGKDKTYDELENKQSNKEINQVVSMIRNATANAKKQFVPIDTVDRTKTGERYGMKKNNAIYSYTNIKIKPNINVSMNDKDASNLISKDIKIDPMEDLIKKTSEFIN